MPAPVLLTLLQQLIPKQAGWQEAEWTAFLKPWQPLQAKRKTVLTAAGEVEKYLYLVVEGVQRAYFLDPNKEKEATIVFTYPPSFSGVIDSLLLQQPSRYYLETLTQSTLLTMRHTDLMQLMEQFPAISAWARQATALALSGVLERHQELIALSAEEKFRKLLARSPHLLQLIPHKYLASYLGLDATTFSKLLGTVRL
jgi:CRP-like cAMP-binding protein